MARRRSARLRKSQTPDRNTKQKAAPPLEQLGSLIERDETPTLGPQPTLDAVVSSPAPKPESTIKNKTVEASPIKTPSTQPRLARGEMHPKEVHRTTTKAPDSGLQLGFKEISSPKKGEDPIAAAQNTPSKAAPRESLPAHLTSPGFTFKLASEQNLSVDARRLMDDVREDAERIKSSILAGRDVQKRKDLEAERMFNGVNGAGRKIAKPQGKAGRFSDVHMAQFKKMDSIADHPSSFRTRPSFAQPTQQSLKRSGSKAGLDEPERPRTAGKETPGRSAMVSGRLMTGSSPFKALPSLPTEAERSNENSPAKRRKSNMNDIHAGRCVDTDAQRSQSRPSTLPRSTNDALGSLLTPTKASLARTGTSVQESPSPPKQSTLPRSNSIKSLKATFSSLSSRADPKPTEPVKKFGLVRSDSTKSLRALPPTPAERPANLIDPLYPTIDSTQSRAPALTPSPSKSSLASKLPTFQGLKSILRSSRKPSNKAIESPTKDTTAGGTPKRNNAAPSESGSTKKVDFTPSTKSRYAVKLAAASPSPSKLSSSNKASPGRQPIVPFDSSAYILDAGGLDSDDDEWEDAGSEIDYPVLPTGDEVDYPVLTTGTSNTSVEAKAGASFLKKAKQHGRRESKEFKSIFTTLDHPSRSNTPTTLTAVNTRVNVRGPGESTIRPVGKPAFTPGTGTSPVKPSKIPSSTIRAVRSSGVSNLVQPFEDTIKTVPHGLPGKKRRRESEKTDTAKPDRRITALPPIPGAWTDTDSTENKENHDQHEDEGDKRGGKRARVDTGTDTKIPTFCMGSSSPKKLSKARQQASQHAKDRKSLLPGTPKEAERSGRGFLSLSRLNMLSRPKERK